MLGTLEEEQKRDWKKNMSVRLVYAYNCTPHESTRVSPYELLFGRKPNLPVDTMFEKANEDGAKKSTVEYIEDLEEKMAITHEIIKRHTRESKKKQKRYYDKKTKKVKISVGDRVLVKKLAFDGKHKLSDKFESDTYVVISQPRPDIPVFKVKSETSDKEKTLHRNHLLLIGFQEATEERMNEEDGTTVSKELDDRIDKKDASKDYGTEDMNRAKDDVIKEEDSSDEEYEDEGYGHAAKADRYGDAHNPTDEVEVVKEQKGDDNDDLVEVRQEVEDEDTVEQLHAEPVREGGLVDTDEVVDHSYKDAVTEVKSVSETLGPDVIDTKVPNDRNKDKDKDNESAAKVDEEAGVEEASGCEGVDRVSRPVPPPRPSRRSTRDRKPPDKYADYYMMQMVN